MSGLVGAAQAETNPGQEDIRLNRADFRPIAVMIRPGLQVEVESFATEWWPGSGMCGLVGDTDGIECFGIWGPFDVTSGASSRFGFAGVTRDQYGSPIYGCTVKLYRTGDDVLLDTQISDPNTGAFLLNTPYYPDAHYIVAHKSGAPDVDGVTVNTLIAT